MIVGGKVASPNSYATIQPPQRVGEFLHLYAKWLLSASLCQEDLLGFLTLRCKLTEIQRGTGLCHNHPLPRDWTLVPGALRSRAQTSRAMCAREPPCSQALYRPGLSCLVTLPARWVQCARCEEDPGGVVAAHVLPDIATETRKICRSLYMRTEGNARSEGHG